MAIDNSDREREVKNPRVTANLGKYVNAVNTAKQLFEPNKGIITYDDPKRKFSYHCMTIQFIQDEYDNEEVRIIASIIEAFDSLFIYSKSDGTIYLQLIIHDIYTEET